MSLLAGRVITLFFYAATFGLLLYILLRLHWRTYLTLFVLPLTWMTLCYIVLVYHTFYHEPWEHVIPFLQVGQWTQTAAVGVVAVVEYQLWRRLKNGL